MQVLRAPQAVSGTAAEIGSVVVPLLAQDLSGGFSGPLGQVLDLWSQERFRPRIGGMSPPVLVLMFNRASPEQLAEARALVGARPVLMESFAGVEVLEAGLEGERDLYARGAKEAQGAFGNKAGPNFLFQAGMEAAAAFGGFALQIEVDCLPTGPGWLDAAAQVARGSARAWVVGSIFAGPRIDRSIQTHLNGNALYRAGDPNFQTFLREVWMADLVARAQRMPYLAYDCWWALIGHEADSWLANDAWHLWQRYESFFRSDPFVVNLLGGRDSLMRYIETYDRFADLDRAPVFFHGPVMKEVLPVLLQNPRDSLFDTLERLATDAEEEPPEPPAAEGRLVLVSGFHPIGRAAPQHGGRPHAWSAKPAMFLVLQGTDRLRVMHHTRSGQKPQLALRDVTTGRSIPLQQSWIEGRRRGILEATVPEGALLALTIEGPADQFAPRHRRGEGLMLLALPGQDLVALPDAPGTGGRRPAGPVRPS